MIEIQGKYNTAKIFTDNMDDATRSQVKNLLDQPSVQNSVIRIMPDCHAGAGCVIGTTMTISDKVIPNLVGVDIGCGMLAFKLKEKKIDLSKFDSVVHKEIPAGFNIRETPLYQFKDVNVQNLRCYQKQNCKVTEDNFNCSLGTLGGGNHFIELDRDEEDNIWIVVHTGSRHTGLCVAEYYQRLAYEENNNLGKKQKQLLAEKRKQIVEKLTQEGRQKEISKELEKLKSEFPKETITTAYEVAYCEGDLMKDYLHDMVIMQSYAHINRIAIANILTRKNHFNVVDGFETVHNYINTADMILRKGSVSARKDEILLIPINMRDGSLICKGKGNSDWNYSAPHGAGRIMSRTEAVNSISMKDYKESMKGIFSTCINKDTIDESAFAYKPIDEIIKNIEPTVEIVSRIKPIYNFKAGSED